MASANGAVEAVEVETQQQVDPMVEADQKYAEGSAFLKAEEYEKAIASLSRALELRVEKFGELAPECASAYFKYGSALLQKAQSEGDVLGEKAVELSRAEEEAAQMPCDDDDEANEGEGDDGDGKAGSGEDAAEDGVDGVEGEKPSSAEAAEVGEAAAEDKKEGDAAAAPGADNGVEEVDGGAADEKDGDEEKEGGEDGAEGEDTAAGAEEEEEDDLELAWKLLDSARVIHERQPGHTVEEADVLTALGDVSLEREDFVTGLEDFQKALGYLEELLPSDDRAIAAVCFKMASAHQLALHPQEALSFCQRAIAVVELRLKHLEEEKGSKGKEKEGEAPKVAEGETKPDEPLSEVDELKFVLQEMRDKEEELKDFAARPTVMEALKAQDPDLASKMQQAFAAAAGLVSNGVPEGDATAASAAIAMSGFDAPKLSANQQDLGVVGRGKARITPAGAPSAGASAAAFQGDGSGAGALPAPTVTGKRRTLEQIVEGMASVAGEASAEVPVDTVKAGSAAADDAHPAKKTKVDEPAAASNGTVATDGPMAVDPPSVAGEGAAAQ
ncbi:hypothetical protein CBR_g26200 [Chara braunii]|uniref:Tetratricopeptide SHNi-TPR domain-containing protein n=1 Tax=Chara braunii TaxID=69332 RepID=A0A388L793_CHABU|nr:hypothetical protein CBR_g26200 [Chara braunii]|eukprot:GBG78167.1 hypothetical protein CBR_g26200 [Chara braunii]